MDSKKKKKKKIRHDSHAQITLHSPFSLTRNVRDKRKEVLDVCSGKQLVQSLFTGVVNVINVNY